MERENGDSMNYIVVDLEWNQNPEGKRALIKEMPFEIVEIGAIKVSEQGVILGEFHEYVRPKVYQTLHQVTKELIHIDEQVLLGADSFPIVVQRFFEWCGEEYMFCTWGVMDLTELQKNLQYHKLSSLLVGPIRYYDVQKLFSLQYEGKKIPHTLEYAVDYLQIEKSEAFHSAIHDARYTAKILEFIDSNVKKNFSIDCFHNPKMKKEEIYVVYDTYSKYITKEYATKEELLKTSDVRLVSCYKCNKRAIRKIGWFSSNAKNYYSLWYCKEHGYLKSKISVKKTGGNKYYAIKIVKRIDKEEALSIYERERELRMKRNEKKKQNIR